MKAIFSIKANPGVPDNAPLNFAFKTLNDGEAGTIPKGGWPAAILVGSVDSYTAPTTLSASGFWNYLNK